MSKVAHYFIKYSNHNSMKFYSKKFAKAVSDKKIGCCCTDIQKGTKCNLPKNGHYTSTMKIEEQSIFSWLQQSTGCNGALLR